MEGAKLMVGYNTQANPSDGWVHFDVPNGAPNFNSIAFGSSNIAGISGSANSIIDIGSQAPGVAGTSLTNANITSAGRINLSNGSSVSMATGCTLQMTASSTSMLVAPINGNAAITGNVLLQGCQLVVGFQPGCDGQLLTVNGNLTLQTGSMALFAADALNNDVNSRVGATNITVDTSDTLQVYTINAPASPGPADQLMVATTAFTGQFAAPGANAWCGNGTAWQTEYLLSRFVIYNPVTQAGVISGIVFQDVHEDGVYAADDDPGISGVTVIVFNASNVAVANTTTSANGTYSISGLTTPGVYTVQFSMVGTQGLRITDRLNY